MSDYLSAEEVKRLGLDEPQGEYLSADEVKRLGLDAPDSKPVVAPVAAGAMQGFGLGFGDELVGARNALASTAGRALGKSPLAKTLAAALPYIVSPGGAQDAALKAVAAGQSGEGSLLGDYRKFRDEARQTIEAQKQANPDAFLGGEVLGSLAAPVPFGKAKAATTLGKVGLGIGRGALIGGGYGLGSSNADLTKGEFGKAALDTGIGVGVGGLAGGVGEGIGQGAGWVLKKARAKAAQGIAKAVEEETAAQVAKKAKDVRSASGALGGEAAASMKNLERMQEMVGDASLPQGMREEAARQLATPEMQALKERALSNYLEKAPEQMGRVQSAEQALADARAIDVGKVTEEALANPVKRHVLPRAMTLGHRFLPVAATMAGGAIHPALGAAAGSIMALAQGRPGIVIRNLATKPAVRKMFWEGILKASGGAGRVAQALPALESAAAKGEQAFSEAMAMAADQVPEIRDAVLRWAGTEQKPKSEVASAY